jgi:hypothetical protein
VRIPDVGRDVNGRREKNNKQKTRNKRKRKSVNGE